MRSRFVEVTQGIEGGFNHGKFMVAQFDQEEWERISALDEAYAQRQYSLIARCAWSPAHVMVFDLQTGEGAMFLPGGMPSADLEKHKIWVCPMFAPFLGWLYEWVGSFAESARRSTSGLPRSALMAEWFEKLPPLLELPDAPSAQFGYRRKGPEG